jgi:secreted PhoX family phosphatase
VWHVPKQFQFDQKHADWVPSRGGSDPFATCFNRRAFLRGGAALVGGMAVTASLQSLTPKAFASNGGLAPSPYGPPVPTVDEATGLRLISLPHGFRYKSYGWTGDLMEDGILTPAMHDGMGVTDVHGHKVVMVRDHEVGRGPAFGPNPYSPDGGGGNTNLVFDLKNESFESAKTSLSGTVRNCAGGVTPWGTWISCEETTETTFGNTIKHGYCFDVASNGNAQPKPLREMGRFSHEAVAVDPATGYVYETEDDGDNSGVYRFLPKKSGVLHQGGKLQMLRIAGTHQFDTRTLPFTGTVYDVEWVDVPNPDPNLEGGELSTFRQGFNASGTRFRRPEGIWYGNGTFFFVCTSGGPITSSGQGEGQVWMYDPHAEKLQIIYASTDRSILENPDNIVVNPDGTLMLCEDNSGSTTNPGERLHILTPSGLYQFAMNNMDFTAAGLGSYTRSGITYTQNMRQNEWAGATYSPDGKWLFVNIQTPGVTFAITGPWVWL